MVGSRVEWLVNDISLVLDVFKDINHEEHQAVTASRSVCKESRSASLLILRYITQSSANNRIRDETHLGRSLMKIKKSRGPRTLPWGLQMLKEQKKSYSH